MTATEPLPLFPLHTVLLPGAPLGLRVFGRRYLGLVADYRRDGAGSPNAPATIAVWASA